MTNHVHMLARPASDESPSKMMQRLVEEETYLWTVSRYIEQNPVLAQMVKTADEYLYSSARAHINGTLIFT